MAVREWDTASEEFFADALAASYPQASCDTRRLAVVAVARCARMWGDFSRPGMFHTSRRLAVLWVGDIVHEWRVPPGMEFGHGPEWCVFPWADADALRRWVAWCVVQRLA